MVVLSLTSQGAQPQAALASGTANVFSTSDTAAYIGSPTSLAIDSAGRPVVAYYVADTKDLKVLRCGDATCSSGNSVVAVDTVGDVGSWASLELDQFDNPVVSYYDATNADLKLLRCGTPTCGSGNSITSPATTGTVGLSTSLELDGSGNPVVSLVEFPMLGDADINVLHCNDADCAGADESLESPNPSNLQGGGPTALELTASGNPVVVYGHTTVMRCNDPDCSGGDEGLASLYPGTFNPSLVLNAAGNPLFSGVTSALGGGVKAAIQECGNPTCSGSASPLVPVDDVTDAEQASLALDSGGAPVVAYYDGTKKDLKIARCGSLSCKAGVSVATPDSLGNVGKNAALVLDASDNPVVSYSDESTLDLKILHCGNLRAVQGTPSR